MTDPIKVTVHTMLRGVSFWSQDVQCVDGGVIKVHTDGPIGSLQSRNDDLTAFIERCVKQNKETVNGAALRKAAREVLGYDVTVTPPGEPE